jgi:hypothetical protein
MERKVPGTKDRHTTTPLNIPKEVDEKMPLVILGGKMKEKGQKHGSKAYSF